MGLEDLDTPSRYCDGLLQSITNIVKKNGGTPAYIEALLRDVFKSKATEDELLKVFVEINQKGSAPLALVTATMACSCQALRAECDGDLLKAWRHAARASYFCGLYISQQSGGDFFLGNGMTLPLKSVSHSGVHQLACLD